MDSDSPTIQIVHVDGVNWVESVGRRYARKFFRGVIVLSVLDVRVPSEE